MRTNANQNIEKRKAEATRITQRFNDRLPVICEKAENSDIQEIDKRKYLVPGDLSVGQFVYVIRKRIKLPSEKAIFIFINDILPPTAALMSTIYEEHKDEDGFLYVLYSGENTFGETEMKRLNVADLELDFDSVNWEGHRQKSFIATHYFYVIVSFCFRASVLWLYLFFDNDLVGGLFVYFYFNDYDYMFVYLYKSRLWDLCSLS